MASPDTHQLPVRLPEDLYVVLKTTAQHTERSMNEIVVAALTEHLLDDDRRAEIDLLAAGVRRRYRRALDELAK